MNLELVDFLKESCSFTGVSGFENEVSNFALSKFSELGLACEKDVLGNITAVLKGKGKYKVMLAAHIDEIGLMVSFIDERGFLKFTPIGGIDPRTLISQEVKVHGSEELFGIIGIKPPHVTSPSERKKPLKFEDMAVDCGLTFDEISKIVHIGDLITLDIKPCELLNKKIAAKALDDRAGLAVMYETAKILKEMHVDSDVYFTGTTMEELGSRGAKTATYQISPDIGIAIDVTFGKAPGISGDDSYDLGSGAAIGIGAAIHPNISSLLKKTASENNISHTLEVMPGLTGTDMDNMSHLGAACGTVSIPLKYMHQAVEMADIRDIKSCARLISSFIHSLNHLDESDLFDTERIFDTERVIK